MVAVLQVDLMAAILSFDNGHVTRVHHVTEHKAHDWLRVSSVCRVSDFELCVVRI